MNNTQYKIEVMQAFLDGQEIEQLSDYGWNTVKSPVWNWFNTDYRVKPKTPLVIPWEVISDEFKWAAADNSGHIWVYIEKPDIYKNGIRRWFSPDGVGVRIDQLLIGVSRGTIDWKDSLIQRPTGE